MSTSRRAEYRIIRQLLERRDEHRNRASVERFITVVAVVASLGLLLVFAPGMLWVVLLGAFVLTLGA